MIATVLYLCSVYSCNRLISVERVKENFNISSDHLCLSIWSYDTLIRINESDISVSLILSDLLLISSADEDQD